jgi:hypothetical protein
VIDCLYSYNTNFQYARTRICASGKKDISPLACVLNTSLTSIPSSKNPTQTGNWSFVTTSSYFRNP